MSFIGNTNPAPGNDAGRKFLIDRDCFLKLFEGCPNLCFDRVLKDRLDRFSHENSKSPVNGYKVWRFVLSHGNNRFLGNLITEIAKFVYNDQVLRSLVHKLDTKNKQKAYDIYTDYFERLAQKKPILIIISNFYEEIDHIDDDELNLFCLMMEQCENVKIWICGEDTMNKRRSSAYYDFYKLFDPIPLTFYESLQAGDPLPYVYFSYSWEARSNNTVDRLCDIIRENRIPHQRDKENCGYRSDIHDFMNHIRRGNHVVVMFSKPYLESFYCLYELAGILEQPDYEKRIFPIIVDSSIREDEYYKKLVEHWNTKLQDRVYMDSLKDKTVGRFTLKRKAELMKDYIKKLPLIKDYLSRIDAYTLSDMEAQDFSPLIDELSRIIRVRV